MFHQITVRMHRRSVTLNPLKRFLSNKFSGAQASHQSARTDKLRDHITDRVQLTHLVRRCTLNWSMKSSMLSSPIRLRARRTTTTTPRGKHSIYTRSITIKASKRALSRHRANASRWAHSSHIYLTLPPSTKLISPPTTMRVLSVCLITNSYRCCQAITADKP